MDERLKCKTIYAISATTEKQETNRELSRKNRRRTLTKQLKKVDGKRFIKEAQAGGETDPAKLAIFAASAVVMHKRKKCRKRQNTDKGQSEVEREPQPGLEREILSDRSLPPTPLPRGTAEARAQDLALRRKALTGRLTPPLENDSRGRSTGNISVHVPEALRQQLLQRSPPVVNNQSIGPRSIDVERTVRPPSNERNPAAQVTNVSTAVSYPDSSSPVCDRVLAHVGGLVGLLLLLGVLISATFKSYS